MSNVLQHFDPCQVILDCTLLCRMSVALFVLTEPPAHQLSKSADTVPPLRNSPFFSPSPSKRNFFLMPQNDVKDQRRRLSDPLRNNFRSPAVLICIYIYIVTCFFIWRLILINSIYMYVCLMGGGGWGLDIKWNSPAQRIVLRSNHYSVKLCYVKMKI